MIPAANHPVLVTAAAVGAGVAVAAAVDRRA
jgi:hypothetical protein